MKVLDLMPCREAGGGGRKNTSNVPDCIQFATWNIGTMSGRSAEVVETLHRRKTDVCCVQETRWTGSGARVMGKGMSTYKNSSGRVVKTVMQGLSYLFQTGGLIGLLM